MSSVGVPKPLRHRDALLDVTGRHDVFGRLDLPERLAQAWAWGGAVGVVRRTRGHEVSLMVWGEVGDLDPLVAGVLGGGLLGDDVRALTVPAAALPTLATVRRVGRPEAGIGWEWMWTQRAPAVPALPAGLVLLDLDDSADAAEIGALGRRENPRFEGWPGQGVATRWVGVRTASEVGKGSLLACGAVHRRPSGAGHLGGILVAASRRGQGLGRAVTAELTARVVADDGVCTLSLYADNAPARRLYASLSYEIAARWLTLPFAE